MKRDAFITVFIILIAGVVAAWLFTGSDTPGSHAHDEHNNHAAHEGHGTHEEHAEDIVKGPHGGRLLEDGDFAVEVTIFETGIPPEFHVYAYQQQKPVAPDQLNLDIELKRLGGVVDRFSFNPEGDYLRGRGEVVEPHSFDVTVAADFEGRQYSWSYSSHEGRTQIPEAIASESGIKTETAGPETIHQTLSLTARVQADPDRLSQVRPRFPGMVQSVRRNLGDSVKAGDVLATVQSNESLQTYSVKAPIAGMIIKRDVQLGEATGDEPMFVIADLSNVWVELDLFSRDLAQVRVGQNVTVQSLDGQYRTRGVINWISPLAAHASQSVTARVPIDNAEGELRLGQFVRGMVEVADYPAPLAVKQSALQRFRDHQVVFARFGDTYEVRMLELGRGNRDWIEVLGGLVPGTEYVTANSYLIKADIEKSGASHDH
jgi:cobalt-zinc-cadmium efflux system membrane fusion protein